jgi:hypothetical protein
MAGERRVPSVIKPPAMPAKPEVYLNEIIRFLENQGQTPGHLQVVFLPDRS